MRTLLENEALLQRIRDWLSQTEAELRSLEGAEEPSATGGVLEEADPQSVGLLPLCEAFTALRHELKLQTKSARGLEDTVQAALAGLEQAVARLESVPRPEADEVEAALKPFVLKLVELDEALERGEQACRSLEQHAVQEAAAELKRMLKSEFRRLTILQRWRSRDWNSRVQEICTGHLGQLQERLLTPLREGYELIRARLQRLLDAEGICRIECLGLPVDPRRMIVVELVDDERLVPGSVNEVLRPGYTWRDRVVRCAEVRAVRPPAPVAPPAW